ncbi:FkbM family methyltransferase [Novipirellula maiorica]|uniref:FkbM family methyltransferase n=1 Tax=Novipirellula maiorica TaxID=1265734 RepID=UPI001F37BBF8|nr:FkbM family methyltransferase [Rhodopirellula maiorica]
MSLSTAEWYAEKFKRWPAVFDDVNHVKHQRLPAGMEMNLGVVDVIERTLRTTTEWDPIVEKTLLNCLQPGHVFFDVGANIGYFSLLASRLVGDSGRVVSFEPSARALSKLTAHLCLNRCSNVTVCSQAMGESVHTEQLHWAPESNIGGSTIARGKPSQGYSESIFIRRLDDVADEMQLAPDLIKLDIEGFELFALRGAQKLLAEHHPTVVCELTNQFLHDHGQSGSEMLCLMRDLGYEAWLLNLNDAGELRATHCDDDQTPADQAEILFSTTAPPFSQND